jgi:hypothetical protein
MVKAPEWPVMWQDANKPVRPPRFSVPHFRRTMVELRGIEPLTSSLRTRRSPS